MKLALGIDEAGRGSIVGPMVVAAVLLDEVAADSLKQAGVSDSKTLTPEKRYQLQDIIAEKATWYAVAIVPPVLIDSYNLNKLTGLVAYYLIKRACRLFSITKVTLDMVKGINFPLLKCSGRTLTVNLEEKADTKYIEVAAASIIAKVTRDNIIEELRKKYGLTGSGYPGDPRTLEWLKHNIEKVPPDILRKKWSTLKKLETDQGYRR